jgi:DNA-binding transcriptional regulator PaaX
MVCLATDPGARGRDIAEQVGITERATQAILADLIADGYLTKHRDGRRNRYELHLDEPLRHPLESEQTIGDLLAAVLTRK